MIEAVWIKDPEWETLSDIWNQILKKSESNNIFLTWEWVSTWWRHFGEGRKLLVLLFKKDGNIIGFAPLIYTKKRVKFLNLGIIEFIGTGLSDYGDFILTKEKEACMNLIIDFLEKEPIKWDMMDLRHIPENSSTSGLLKKLAKERSYNVIKKGTNCMYVPLSQTWEEYFRTLSSNRRYDLRRSLRKCNKDHSIYVKHLENMVDFEETINDFFDLYVKWLMERYNISSIFNIPLYKVKQFLTDLAHILFITQADGENLIDLSFFMIDGKPASSCYSFIYDKIFFAYMMPWDSSYSKYNIGNLHLMYLLEYSMKQGLKKFDFLRGNEPYKNRWNAMITKNSSITFFRKNLKGNLLHFLLRAREESS